MFHPCQSNNELVETLIQNKKNSFQWDEMNYTQEVVKCVFLEPLSPEYVRIKNKFDASMKYTVSIKKIERIQSPYLLAAYEIKKAEIIHRFNNVVEKVLFHGTSDEKAALICLDNFDWRLCGKSRGHKFGKGVSFSPKSSYSRHYCKFQHVMVVSCVLEAHSEVGRDTTTLPSKGHDTTHKITGDVIVKYEDNEFYPAYKIFF